MAKTIIEELVGVLGLEIDKQAFDKGSKSLANLKNQYEKVASAAQKFALAGAALTGFAVITNKLTAEQENLAAAVGLSGQTLDAYGAIAKQAGLDTENVIDLAEELNNKIGESKGIEQITAVKEAFSILGLEFEKINKLNPEQQLFAVVDAASKLEDQQKAVAATDILLGGEANKLTGFIRSQDKSLRELLDTQIRLNLLTQKSRDEAKAFNKSFGQLSVIIGSATKQLAALLGKGLKPVVDFIVNWVAENKQLAQSIIRVFSVVLPAALGVAGIAVAALTAKLVAMGLAILGVQLSAILIPALIFAAIAFVGLLLQDIQTFINYGFEADTIIGDLIKKFKEWSSFDFSSFFTFDNAIQQLKNLLRLVNNIGNIIGEKLGIFPLIRRITGGPNSSGDKSQRNSTFSGQSLQSAPISPASQNSTSNISNVNKYNINIDATGMDSEQLNRAIDSRVGQQNALAASANGIGIVR